VSDVRRCQTTLGETHTLFPRNVKGFFIFLIISITYVFVDRGTFVVNRRKPPSGGLTSDTSDTCKLRSKEDKKMDSGGETSAEIKLTATAEFT
jgi:hypothetical protein